MLCLRKFRSLTSAFASGSPSLISRNNLALRLVLRLRLALVKCFRFHSLHGNGCFFRTALLRFRRSAPKCSLSFLRCPALSVGDANFLSVSENQSLVHCLSLFQHFSLLKYVSNITTPFFRMQELFSRFCFIFLQPRFCFPAKSSDKAVFYTILPGYLIYMQKCPAEISAGHSSILTDPAVGQALPPLYPADCLPPDYSGHIDIPLPHPVLRPRR